MMSILIRGMEMPPRCYTCPCADLEYYDCNLMPGTRIEQHKRLDDCPLVEIPPHGRLIDADALRASIGESIEECHKWAGEVDKDAMMYARISQSLGTFVECSLRAKAAPTIIPASEEGE